MNESNILQQLGITTWKLKEDYKLLHEASNSEHLEYGTVAPSSQNNNVKIESETNNDSSSVQLVLNQAEYNLYQANRDSIKKFFNDLLSFYGRDSLIVSSENDQRLSQRVIFCGCEDKEMKQEKFYSLEQLFLYPPRKKQLYYYLDQLIQN